MSDSATVLKEYLISVGLKADTNSLSKFMNLLGGIEKMAFSMTGALIAGVSAIETLVSISTSQLDDLYWATKRMKSSASDIQDFQLRMAKAGSSAADARQALETLSAFRRTNPAGDAFLGLMGINTQGKGDVEVMGALVNRFKQLNAQGQYWLAVQFGERIGLDEKAVWSMVQTSAKAEHVYADMYKRLGINQKQATQNAHDYANKLKDFDAELEVVTQALGLKFLPVADKFLTWLMTSQAASNIGGGLYDVAGDIANIADGAAKLLNLLPSEAQEFGLIGWFLFGRKAAIIFAAVATIESFLLKLGKKDAEEEKKNPTTYLGGVKRRWDSTWSILTGKPQDAPPSGKPRLTPYTIDGNQWKSQHPAAPSVPPVTSPDTMLPLIRGLEKSGDNAVSPKGAIGRYQIMPGTARQYGFDPSKLKDPKYNEMVARVVIADLIKQFQGDVAAVLVAYNAGPGRAARFVKSGKDASLLPQETQKYLLRAGFVGGPGDSAPGGSSSPPSLFQPTPLGQPAGSKNIMISQGDTTVNIHNAKDPVDTAKQVKRVADRRSGDMVRNFSTAIQ